MRELDFLRVAVLIIGLAIALLLTLLVLVFRLYKADENKNEPEKGLSYEDFPWFENLTQFKAAFYERHPEFIEECRRIKLSDRETELAALKAVRMTNHEISSIMGISLGTVYTLSKRVKRKKIVNT